MCIRDSFTAMTPTFIDISTGFIANWAPVTGLTSEIHTEIAVVDRLSTFSMAPMIRNTHYFKLTTDCLSLTSIPYIKDKDITVGEKLDEDWDDDYNVPKYCAWD